MSTISAVGFAITMIPKWCLDEGDLAAVVLLVFMSRVAMTSVIQARGESVEVAIAVGTLAVAKVAVVELETVGKTTAGLAADESWRDDLPL